MCDTVRRGLCDKKFLAVFERNVVASTIERMRFASRSKVAISTVTLAAITSLTACGTGGDPDTGTAADVPVNRDTPAVTDTRAIDSGVTTDVAMTIDTPTAMDTPVTTTDVPTTRDVQPGTDTGPRPDVVPTDGGGGACAITPDVAAHVAAMSTMGWSAQNRTRSMLMYGCPAGRPATECLATAPIVDDTNIGATRSALPAQHLRLLYSATNRSNYWTRISADGRFVGRGTHIHDMTRNAEVQATGAMYDPAFFPDNSRFMYQPGGNVCPTSVLTTGTPTSVTVTAAPCVSTTVGLYEHLGVSLDGADYWATSAGAAAWDDGGHAATLRDPPPNSPWRATAQVNLTLMANTGTTFASVTTVSVLTPFQGDAVISPSGRLLLTRVVDSTGTTMTGYVLHALNAVRTGSAVSASIREIGRYCSLGAKPAFSLDERWITLHHYVTAADATDLGFTGPDDAGFAEYRTRGASNIYLVDLVTGTRTRLTNMAPGQYAQYPAFRSDGWIYFIVRTLGSTAEHVVATDAALVLP